MVKPILSKDSLSFDVFFLQLQAWFVERKIEEDTAKLQILPICIDEHFMAPLLNKFNDHRTTFTTALEALKEEFVRQTRPSNPEMEFHSIKTAVPSEAISNCLALSRLARYLDLNDSAVKHRLFNSFSSSIQQTVSVWKDAHPNSTSRDMANFVVTIPDSTCISSDICAIARSRPVCEHCKKVGHRKETCFKLRTCYNCNEMGHISRYCKKSKN